MKLGSTTEKEDDGKFFIEEDVSASDVSGLGNLALKCEFVIPTGEDPLANKITLEAAGVEAGMPAGSDFTGQDGTDNFVIDSLVVGVDTEDDDAVPSVQAMGANNASGNNGKNQGNDTDFHIIGNGDALVVYIDAFGNVTTTPCLVPPPPK